MARRLPAFPVVCSVYRGGPPGVGALVYSGPAEKRVGVSGSVFGNAFPLQQWLAPMPAIYFPAGTDVRGDPQVGGGDYIEWAGNPQWVYLVRYVDDVADGFANKFRVAYCTPWSVPTPLP